MYYPLTKNELLCKHFYLNGLCVDKLIEGGRNTDHANTFDIAAFQNDKSTLFAKTVHQFNEDLLFPLNTDVSILRHPRYMPIKVHAHDFLEFVYMYEGNCVQYLDDKPYHLIEGDLFLLAPGTFHTVHSYDDACILFYIMVRKSTFDTAFLSLLSHNDILASFFAQTIYNDEKDIYLQFKTSGDITLKNLVRQMYDDSLNEGKYTARLLNVQFEYFCLNLLKNHINHIKLIQEKRSIANIIGILNYIFDCFKTVTLDEICARFRYSRGHIQRLIKKNTGFTFHEVLTQTKIQHACELLKNQSLTVQNVAEAIGYGDISNFHKVFKKQMKGITPAQYRKSVHI